METDWKNASAAAASSTRESSDWTAGRPPSGLRMEYDFGASA
jgi:hypothetical protein